MTVQIRKVKRKRINGALVLLFFSFISFFITKTFLESYNVSLNIKYQKNQERIIELTKQSEALAIEVQELSTYDRIMAMVTTADMEFNVNNVINVGN